MSDSAFVDDLTLSVAVAIATRRDAFKPGEKLASGYIDDARAAIAEAQRWFPIETAPTDGTTILLWWRYSRHGNVGRWIGDQDGEFGWAGDEDDCIPLNQQDCLYWQSLPEPPQL